ncbi:hypothetical protein P152DRAFT_389959 [Eremomyces bilateralis CBS 781.70]|uniref:Complex 1 LYR protein domain-containing protein n=1 Tax=Eremomyces bilateralis CBS 781.70 TaxID=1392243 RepID=A0A6G1GD25_9PEZI|nr:uncharacterized protein P152DRAFT_389959 [Eremomyces bilateralis CBS 781.70]KAF1815912.1 hypothetical protein P152DRAFT_389959 [Eremomyces bilateralis CBS 781.70]
MPRHSGLQREVLALYQRCILASKRKPTVLPGALIRPLTFACRSEFRRYADVDRKDFGTIEFLLRKGRRQLEILDSPGVTRIS